MRELENILERAMTLCEGDMIEVNDLQLPIHKQKQPITNAANEEPGEDSVVIKLDPMLENKEREVIEKALKKTRYNKTAAAKLLGISFRALRYRIKKLGIE